MAYISSSKNSVKKLNNFNYNNWSTHMQFYLRGQDLWDIISGDNITPPMNDDELRKWNIKAAKSPYALARTVEDDLMQHIKSAQTTKEAWDNLVALFARSKDAQVAKLDPKNAIFEPRMRGIIIHGLRSQYNGIVMATRGWANVPTLTELENLLANQETLDKQMSKVLVKEDESVLFSNKRGFKSKRRTNAGNVAASKKNDSKEEWDFQASIAVEEQEELVAISATKLKRCDV
ncbi:uncharacterized protein LOC125316273 [Rhodamnia argentea]|uniref:Uncharacterized protein LOC125316273 n=1 Tax=Rhodamnia argentea TaxID=178133 RepID=A0ABM3HUF5_9MYRT|nr:uncharacterized protein LOC125316273 [Rhodamnia argentea]